MIKNYLLTAYRNLLRNKSYAFINVTGLSIGIAACLLIFIVIQFETSFDTYHQKADRIYRMATEFNSPDGKFYSGGSPLPTAGGLRIDYPELEHVASIAGGQSGLVHVPDPASSSGGKNFKENNGVFIAEAEFFDIFDIKWLAGDPKTALKETHTAVLSKETATRYFGDWKSAIGKSIRHDNRIFLKITGIIDDAPLNSDFPLKVVISYPTIRHTPAGGNVDDWVSVNSEAHTYVVLPKNMSFSSFKATLPAFVKRHKPAEYVREGYVAQPLRDIHFDERYGNFNGRTFSRELITALMVIGLFLMIIACVNFINLATAQAVNRAKEVGVRKVLGSSQLQLAAQFIGETSLITFFAMLLGTTIAIAALPFLSTLLEVKLSFSITPTLLLFMLGVFIVVTLVSGLYPAFVLSAFNPITALKNKAASKSKGGITLRRALVVVQFCIAQALIIGMLLIVDQMNFFRNSKMGFDKEAILTVRIPNDSISKPKFATLRHKLAADPGISKITFSLASPADYGSWNSDFRFDNALRVTDFGANLKWADTGYFNTYNLTFVAGRAYRHSDTTREFVVNESLVKKLGLRNPEEILGKTLNFWDGRKVAPVVGVVRDFHTYSLRDGIPPVVLGTDEGFYSNLGLKLTPGDPTATLARIQKTWEQTFPEYVYEHQFLDEKIESFYKREAQVSTLYKIFSGIAIFISCLGLYGLVAFMAVQRNREVGIRKVMGASVQSIVFLFSREFTLLICIAFGIAAPLSYYMMRQWQQNFTYKVPIHWSVFLTAILTSILIAWVTVGYKAVKAALANPIKSLRTE